MRIREMNDFDLMRAILDSGRTVVTAFVERGSEGGKSAETQFRNLAKRLGDEALFSIVDVCENPTITRKFGGGDVPSVALFRDAKHLGSHACEAGDMSEFIQQGLRKE